MLHDKSQRVLPFHLDQVLSDELLASLISVSLDTLQRQRAKGNAPPRTRLSDRRHGTRMRHYVEWLDEHREGQKPDERPWRVGPV